MKTPLAIVAGLGCEALLMLGRMAYLRQGQPPPHLLGWLGYVVPLFITYFWLVRDRRDRQATLDPAQMALAVLAPMIGVPLYLFRTRTPQQRPRALLVFGLVLVAAAVMARTAVRSGMPEG